MSRRGWWIATFLLVTATAVGMELWAAVFDHSGTTVPWTDLLTDLPWWITLPAATILCAWLVPHLVHRYRQRGRLPKEGTMTTVSLDPNEDHPREPLWSVGSIVAGSAVVLDAAVVWGLPLPHDKETALLAVINVAAPIVVAVWGRRKVFSPATVARLLLAAKRAR